MSAAPRSEGTTPSERYLVGLSRRTFLSLWSHANLYRDKGLDAGKELCDLLVVFGKCAIVFSDKECTFPDTGDLNVDWRRWFRRTVFRAANQVYGAERWLREHPERVFLDPKCTRQFSWPLRGITHFYRVVVARGDGLGSMHCQRARIPLG